MNLGTLTIIPGSNIDKKILKFFYPELVFSISGIPSMCHGEWLGM
jgi:hypothetical protein